MGTLLDIIGRDQLVGTINEYAENNPDNFLQTIQEEFGAPDSNATRARCAEIKRVTFEDGNLYVDAVFSVDYDFTSDEVTTQNVAEHRQVVTLEGAHVTDLDFEDFRWTPTSPFPD